ncbi:MAG: alpha/beta fold hydrolase [Betaproteobacteria bacterium]|nr:alpha/beta fold hydrolase [Betaproteobacteria bacterium]
MTIYRAPWWLPGGHAQTILPSLRPPARIALTRERWDTPDGDFIDVDFAAAPSPVTLALFHGLEGSSDSHYARAFAAHALERGWRIALPHFRGCSGVPNRLPRAYHSGDSAEIDWILSRLAAREGSTLYAAGVSLGGNALLKWLGERGATAGRLIRRAAAISAPIDLTAAGHALDRGFNRQVYARAFLATLKPKALALLARFPGLLDAARVRAASTMYEFDDAVTAPLHGFRDADDYWSRASSAPGLAEIRVPTLVLNARNDPFLPEAALDAATQAASREVLLLRPSQGGHVGFMQSPFPGRHGWLPRRVLDFLAA